MKVSGAWVSPIEIEGVLVEHPAVLEAAVVFRPDSDGFSKPGACVVLRSGEGSPQLAREFRSMCWGGCRSTSGRTGLFFFRNCRRLRRARYSDTSCV
jgi:acyl-coenzyme A synthetase/AMP-(fatty) acid ligase